MKNLEVRISDFEKQRQKSQLQNYYYHVVPAKAGTQNSLYLLDSRLRGNDLLRVLQLPQKDKRSWALGEDILNFEVRISDFEKQRQMLVIVQLWMMHQDCKGNHDAGMCYHRRGEDSQYPRAS
jgi:hypothetical protein